MFICKIPDYWNKIKVALSDFEHNNGNATVYVKVQVQKKHSKKLGIFAEGDLISASNSQFPVAGFQGCPPRHCSYISRDFKCQTFDNIKITLDGHIWF